MKLTVENLIDKIINNKSLGSIKKSITNNIEFENLIYEKTNFLKDETITQRLFYIRNKITDTIKCDCGENVTWNKKYFYNKTCGDENCIIKLQQNLNDETKTNKVLKMKQTKFERYGDENYTNNEKSKQTCLLKYGVDHYTKTEDYKQKMNDKFGYISPFELKKTHEKSKQTLLDRYGVDHNFKISGITAKIKNTWLEKYGVDHPMKSEKVVQKMIKNNNKKWGYNSPMQDSSIQLKSIETLMKNYNVDSPLKSEIILKKFKKNNLEKYGEEHWMKNDNFYNNYIKNLNNKRLYKKIFFNNNIHYLQGYEDYVLENILSKYDKNDILINNIDITNEIGKIYYVYEDIKRKYYPDFFIKSQKLIIEVKSEYTFNIDYYKNKAKENACLNNNLNFQFIIIKSKDYKKWKKKTNKI